ncbi:MAG: hypothetical protein ACLFV2_09615 [Desulfurivibrionaceae bacterium]
MITLCPHCQKNLNLSSGQTEKLKNALAGLESGKRLKFPCPHCRESIEMSKEGNDPQQPGTPNIQPPSPPDLSWLKKENISPHQDIDNIPRALLLTREESIRNSMENLLNKMGYQIEQPADSDEAIDAMQSTDFGLIALHSGYEGSLEACGFHEYMKWLDMRRRRNIFYMLIGPELTTLYNIEALSYSANLVVNDEDTKEIEFIIKKGLNDYETLFGPYFAALKRYWGGHSPV